MTDAATRALEAATKAVSDAILTPEGQVASPETIARAALAAAAFVYAHSDGEHQ